ncbi:helix-turn-helix transcriptional regulator [Kutzneria sp. 744]|uniref:helix-turn-helix domain-containing protein n=1 Tax=Kutzneria sp. (strain 744) TaxID=345341 RepID=UPI0003EEC40A|nr:helix-turn-helix transcriptional regulator [Kutzneria sp. 744]EWM14538.1 LigA protein [Kutzneria sp. 744]
MAEQDRPPFADVLTDLCKNPVDGRPAWTNVALAERVRELGGDINQAYIASLRTGRQDNPTVEVMVQLAGALGVHPAALVGGRRERRPDERPGWRRTALATLFDTAYPADRGPYTPGEVANAINEHGVCGTISRMHVRELRDQTAVNPKLKHLLGLAWHFGVRPEYFLDDEHAARVDAEYAQLRVLAELGVISLVTRINERPDLSPETRQLALESLTRALDPGLGPGEWVFRPGSPAESDAPE